MKITLASLLRRVSWHTKDQIPFGLTELDSALGQRLGEALKLDVARSAALAHIRAADALLDDLVDGLVDALDRGDPRWVLTQTGLARSQLQLAMEELDR